MVLLKDEILNEIHKREISRTSALAGFAVKRMCSPFHSKLERKGMVANPCDSDNRLNGRPSEWEAYAVAPANDEEKRLRVGLEIKNFNPERLAIDGYDFAVGEVYEADAQRNIRGVEHLSELDRSGKIRKLEPQNGRIILEPDQDGRKIYYICSQEVVRLSKELSLLVDSKSGIGRLGCLCVDISRNALEAGAESPVIVAAQPYAFPLEVVQGASSIFQAVLRYHGTPFMSKEEILKDGENIQLFDNGQKVDLNQRGRLDKDGLALTFDTSRVYRAKKPCKMPGPVNVDAKQAYNLEDYFDVIEGNGEVLLEPKRFYLFGTREVIKLGNVCGILRRQNYESTGLWWHFAGIIHPGFEGYITEECRSETKRYISRGEVAGLVDFDKLTRELRPEESYNGVYQHQKAPTVPKMFKTA